MWLINKALRHEDKWESGDIAATILTSAVDGGEWSASRLGQKSTKFASHDMYVNTIMQTLQNDQVIVTITQVSKEQNSVHPIAV
jgi:hypothetical protein